ncbi:hypothetical protein [Streptomyces sp. NPDC001135]
MEEQHAPGRWWRHGPPWWSAPDEAEPHRACLPWRSTALFTAFVVVGTHVAAQNEDHRVPLDGYARVLLVVASVLLLWRHRYPVAVALGTATVTLGYLAAGYPYGPVFLSGRRPTARGRCAWCANCGRTSS